MAHHKTENGLSLLGGASSAQRQCIYLIRKPGRKRRQQIADKAADAYQGGGGALSDAIDHARTLGAELVDRAGELGGVVAGHARNAASGLSDSASGVSDQVGDAHSAALHGLQGLRGRLAGLGHDLLERAQKIGARAQDGASGAASQARESTHSARHALAHAIDPDHDSHASHAAGYAATGLSTLAVGLGAMYFLDPERGEERRRMVVDQAAHLVKETGSLCRKTGQEMMSRFQGISDSARSRLSSSNQVDGEQLVQQIRSQIGEVVSNPSQIQLMADANGGVTIYGRVRASEADKLISTVRNVSGVKQVLNRLEIQDVADASSPSPMGAASVPFATGL